MMTILTGRFIALLQAVPRQYRAHGFDEVCFRHGVLRFGLFLQMLLAAFFQLRQFGADDQILDRDLAFGFFIGALDDDARRVALVGIFELIAEVARIAEIKLGADIGRAQLGDHVLIIGEPVLVEHGDDDRAGLGLCCRVCRDIAALRQAATRRWKIPSPAPARRESARPGHRSGRRRRPSRNAASRPCRRWRRSVQLRTPGRCNIRGRGRRMGQSVSRFEPYPALD